MKDFSKLNLHEASQGFTLLGQSGKVLIVLALIAFLLSAVNALLRSKSLKVSRVLFNTGVIAFFSAFLILAALFVTNQFQYDYIFKHSDKITAIPYKISAVWSGQEGSFLLWACCSALFGLITLKKTQEYQRWYLVPYALFLAILASILAYESPFNLNLVHGKALIPPNGLGLQPTLLNPWIIIHPPVIFLGFGSLTILFCWAFSALMTKNLNDWVSPVRSWAILSATLLGIGLCMGGFWAYETMGWGGFWAWDPVENSSFVPWCFTVAFIHGIFVQISKCKWHFVNAFVAASGFLAFLYGTFLTRSGVLADTSVHSFAKMDRSALKILVALMVFAFSSFLVLWIVRRMKFADIIPAQTESERLKVKGYSRETFYTLAMWLINTMGIAVGIGMSVPFIKSLAGQKIAIVEAGLYHHVLVWLFVPLMLAMGIAPFLSWQSISMRTMLKRLFTVTGVTIGALGVIVLMILSKDHAVALNPDAYINMPFGYQIAQVPWMAFLIGICLFTAVANLWRLIEVRKKQSHSLGGLVTHLGLVLALLGLIISKGFERSEQIFVQESRPGYAFGYWIRYQKMTNTPLHRENKIVFDVLSKNQKFQAKPGLYYVQKPLKEPEPVVWPSIIRHFAYDLYFSLAPPIYEASNVMTFKVGEEKFFSNMLVSYHGIKREGEAGMLGTRFIANLKIKTTEKVFHAHPSLEIAKDGLDFKPAPINEDMVIFLQRLDAKDQSGSLQFYHLKPVYPMEIFYKPMTVLIWIGAGLLAIGGVWSALSRRMKGQRTLA
jgi:cytochrome c-type biogenesis protein CcmF